MASTSTGGLGFSTPPDQLPPSAVITHLHYVGGEQEDLEGMMYCFSNERTGTSVTTKINFSEDGNKIADDQGNTWLHIGARTGSDRLVGGFIAKGRKDLDIDIRNAEDKTPFMLAVCAGSQKVAEILLAGGADIDAFVRDKSSEVIKSNTALTLAVRKNDIYMVRFLLKSGASIAEDAVGATPLHHVLGVANLEMVRTLIDGGCDPHQLTKSGRNSLHLAARNPDLEVMRMLVIEYKVDPNQKDINGYSPLFYSHNPDKEKRLSLARLLLENGAMVDNSDLPLLLKLSCKGETIIALLEHGKILMEPPGKDHPFALFAAAAPDKDSGIEPEVACQITRMFLERGAVITSEINKAFEEYFRNRNSCERYGDLATRQAYQELKRLVSAHAPHSCVIS